MSNISSIIRPFNLSYYTVLPSSDTATREQIKVGQGIVRALINTGSGSQSVILLNGPNAPGSMAQIIVPTLTANSILLLQVPFHFGLQVRRLATSTSNILVLYS